MGSSGESLEVPFVPWGPLNPYQQLLADALRAEGVTVVPVYEEKNAAVLWRAAREGVAPAPVLHLHWTHGFVNTPSRRKSLAKATLFLAQVARVRAAGTRVVWTVHNLVGHESPFPGIERRAYRALVRLVDAVFVHSESARRAVLTAYGVGPGHAGKLHVIRHGSYLGWYREGMDRSEARRDLGIPPEATVFLFIGHIRRYKGVEHLVRTFHRLETDSAVLVIAGQPFDQGIDRSLREAMEAHPRILYFPGFVPDDDVQVFMGAADAVVFPFTEILTSGSVVLAMSFGKAVVTPRLGGVEEYLSPEGGILYDPHQPDGLLEALRQALGEDLEAMGRRNRARAERELRWDQAAHHTAEVYRSLLRAPVRPQSR